MGWRRVLLPDIWPAISHRLDPGLDHSCQNIPVDLLVDLEADIKDVRGHDMALTADHPKDHDVDGELGLHDPGHVLWRDSKPAVVLLIDGLVLAKILLI